MRRAALAIAVLTLGVGPWLAFPAGTFVLTPATAFIASGAHGSPHAADDSLGVVGRTGRAFSSACTCRDINVKATNVVRDAKVRTGDARVVNRSITYISPTYKDDTVEIDQEAIAQSGDAIAGQVLAVAGMGGCSRIHVQATNVVEDAKVRSGDAIAKNKSIVVLDPSINRKNVEIDVTQHADAKSGTALAGQSIGVAGGGGRCGGVVVEAMNHVRDVDVRSGKATMQNMSKILSCSTLQCVEMLRVMMMGFDFVRVCEFNGCHRVTVDDFIDLLEAHYSPSANGADGAEVSTAATGSKPAQTPQPPKHKPGHGPATSTATQPDSGASPKTAPGEDQIVF